MSGAVVSAILNEAALRELVAAEVRKLVARPEYVSQRTVAAVVGAITPRDFLRLARKGSFPSRKEQRLVIARTADVVAALAPIERTKAPLGGEFRRSRSGVRRIAP